jgi:hypothetical protein
MLPALWYEQPMAASPTAVWSSVSYKIETNIAKSLALYQTVTQFDDDALRQAYDYSSFHLVRRPNIYLILVESYGSVLYKRPDYRLDYAVLTKRIKQQLEEAGLTVASALSESPTWGGGSWLAYTSAEFGLRLDNHPQYLALLDEYQDQPYPYLGRYLQQEGYRSYRLSSIADELSATEWAKYEQFYTVDRWFRFEDLAYTGALYGWGPSPPDQYALHAVREQLAEDESTAETPFFLFFITQNSHYPFAPLPPLVDDWSALNGEEHGTAEAVDDENRAHEIRRQDYFAAVEYQLDFLADFMLVRKDEDALFLLVGDHQPPRVSRRADGFATPIHVVSRDADLVASFYEYGFVPGLWVNPAEPTIKHEGLYSMLVRILVANDNPTAIVPPYLPDGYVAPAGSVTSEE